MAKPSCGHSTLEELRARFEKPRRIHDFHLSAGDFEYLLDLAELGEQSRRETLDKEAVEMDLYDFKVVCDEQVNPTMPGDYSETYIAHPDTPPQEPVEEYSLDRYGVSGDFWVFGFMDSLDKMSKVNPFLSVFHDSLKSWQAAFGIPLIAAGLNS